MRPIVFLHGAGMGGWMWRPQIEALSRFQCLAPDLPAHGRNLAEPWTSIHDAARWVAAFIAKEVPGGKAHLVGLSLGAVIGYELLAAFPDSLDKLVLSGGMGLGKASRGPLKKLMRASMPLMKYEAFVSMSLAMMRVPKQDRAEGSRDMTRMSPDALSDMTDQVLSYQFGDVLRSRPHEVLATAGALEAPAIKRSVKRLAQLMPHARAAIVPWGLHTWNWQYPALFTQAVAAWIEGGPLPARL